MTQLQPRVNRAAWFWCLAYTAVVPREPRTRRRAEIRNHLWESDAAGFRPVAVIRATVAGMLDDLGWAAAGAARGLQQLLRTPVLYLAGAALLTVQAAFAWNGVSGRTSHEVQAWSTVGSVALVVAGGIVSVLRRRRY